MKGTMDFLVVMGRLSKAGIMHLRKTYYIQVVMGILLIWLAIFLGGCSLSFKKERSIALKDSAGKLKNLKYQGFTLYLCTKITARKSRIFFRIEVVSQGYFSNAEKK